MTERDKCFYALKELIGYQEDPVSIETFLKEDYFLGSIFNPGGKFVVFDKWMEVFDEIFPNIVQVHPYVAFSGGIGLGKTTAMIIDQLYCFHRFLCIKSFPQFSGLAHSKPYAWTFCTTRLESAAEFIGNIKWYIESSPYFMEQKDKIGKKEWERLIVFKPASTTNHLISNDNLSIVLSEINESVRVNKQGKMQAWELLTESNNRINSRFRHIMGLLPQLLLDSSSKNVDSPIEQFIREAPFRDKLKIFSFAQWEMKKFDKYFIPRPKDRRTRFYVFLGNTEIPAQVIDTEDIDSIELPPLMDKDLCKIAPIELYPEFKQDVEESIRAIMGVSTTLGKTFFSVQSLQNVFTLPLMTQEIIVVNEDDRNYRYEAEPQILKALETIPRFSSIYIGIDLGTKKDLTGIAISYIDKWDEIEINEDIVMKPHISIPIVFGIDREKGQATSIQRIFNFLIYLNTRFTIGMIYCDTYGSIHMLQELQFKGIPCGTYSVESETEYTIFKNLCSNEQVSIADNSLLKAELLCLTRDPKKQGNLNHPLNGKAEQKNGKYIKAVSKDVADACCRAVHAAYSYSRDANTGNVRVNAESMENLMNDLYGELHNDYLANVALREANSGFGF